MGDPFSSTPCTAELIYLTKGVATRWCGVHLRLVVQHSRSNNAMLSISTCAQILVYYLRKSTCSCAVCHNNIEDTLHTTPTNLCVSPEQRKTHSARQPLADWFPRQNIIYRSLPRACGTTMWFVLRALLVVRVH